MEAELNSPMIRLEPGASYAFDTRWYPVRTGRNLKAVSSVGVTEVPLTAIVNADGIRLSGKFGVFFSGKLNVHTFDAHGVEREVALGPVDPLHAVQLDQTIPVAPEVIRVVLHLDDEQGADLGVLGEVEITRLQKDR
jgi:hypothetical protein